MNSALRARSRDTQTPRTQCRGRSFGWKTASLGRHDARALSSDVCVAIMMQRPRHPLRVMSLRMPASSCDHPSTCNCAALPLTAVRQSGANIFSSGLHTSPLPALLSHGYGISGRCKWLTRKFKASVAPHIDAWRGAHSILHSNIATSPIHRYALLKAEESDVSRVAACSSACSVSVHSCATSRALCRLAAAQQVVAFARSTGLSSNRSWTVHSHRTLCSHHGPSSELAGLRAGTGHKGTLEMLNPEGIV